MARKRLNKNVVVALTLTMFGLIVVLSAIMLRSLKQRDPKYFLAHATRYEEARDWQQAALFYSKAYSRSDDPRHLVAFGTMRLNAGQVRQAVGSWRKALIQDPSLVEGHERLLEVLLELARLDGRIASWSSVAEAADKMLTAGDDMSEQAKAVAHHANGLALTKLRAQADENDARATTELEQAMSLDPTKAEYAVDLAVHHLRADRIDEGETLFRKLMVEHASPGPDASHVRVAYGEYLVRSADPAVQEQASDVFSEAIDMAGADVESGVEARLMAASFLARQWVLASQDETTADQADRVFEQAETRLREAIELDEDGFRAFVQLGTLYTADGRHEEAVEICEQRLQRGFERKGLSVARKRINLFNLLLLASQASMAQGVTLGSEGDEAAQLLWLDRSEQYVTQARGEFPTHPKVSSQAGRVKLARGHERAALEGLRQAHEAYLALGTVDWQNLLLLAQLHLRLGEAGAAKEVLDGVWATVRATRAGDGPLWTAYGQAVFQTGDFDQALAISEHLLLIDATSESARQLKAAALERKGRLGEAAILDEQTTGSSAIRAILEARALFLDGNIEGALDLLQRALDKNPANVRLVWTTVGELLKLDRKVQAGAIVERALAERPDAPALRKIAVLANPNLSERQRDEALLAILTAEEDEYLRALGLADHHIRRQAWAEALTQLAAAEKHLLDKDTPLAFKATVRQHWEVLTQIVRVATHAGNEQALASARNSAAEYDVDGAGGASIDGLYYALRMEFEPAIRAFRETVEASPTDAQSLALLGHCLLNVGRTDDAEIFFDRAIRNNPNLVLAYRGRSVIARLRGDEEAYDRAYEAAVGLSPADPWVVSETLSRNERAQPQAAITRREQLLEQQGDDAENLQQLALLCEQVGDLQKADRYFERLLALDSTGREVVMTAAKYFRRTDRPAKSLDLLTRFAQSRSGAVAQAEAMVLLAGHHLSLEDLPQTESTLRDAVAKAETLETVRALAEYYMRNANDPAAALPWLSKAVDLARKAQSMQLSQLMAMRVACLLHRQVDDTSGAQERIADLRRQFPEDLRGIFWESEVLARVGDIEGAIAALSDYLKISPDEPYVLYQRARYYLAVGKTSAALADLERSVRSDPLALDLEPQLTLAALHRRAGRVGEAVRVLEEITKEAPESIRAAEELVRTYIGAEQFEKAARETTAQINKGGDSPDPRWYQLRAEAALRVGSHDAAIADVTLAARKSEFASRAVLIALDVFDRTTRFDDGVSFYRAHESSIEADATTLSKYALLLVKAGRQSEAVEPFRASMKLAVEESVDALRNVTGHLQAAMPVVQAITLFSTTPASGESVRANDRILTRLYRLAGRFDEAAQLLEQTLAGTQGVQERAGLFQEAGDMYQVAGKLDKARTAYEHSLELTPDDWVTLNNLAYLLADGMSENRQALPHAQRAVAFADNPDTLDTLGWIYVGLGDYNLAIAELSRAVRLKPGQVAVLNHLGEAYRRNGQFLEAADVFRRGLDAARADGISAVEESLQEGLKLANERDDSPRN